MQKFHLWMPPEELVMDVDVNGLFFKLYALPRAPDLKTNVPPSVVTHSPIIRHPMQYFYYCVSSCLHTTHRFRKVFLICDYYKYYHTFTESLACVKITDLYITVVITIFFLISIIVKVVG
jgi:hypothetical protein